MAKLFSQGTTLIIKPTGPEFQESQWIEIAIEIQYHFRENEFYTVKPVHKVTFEYPELEKLIEGIEQFIGRLKKQPQRDYSEIKPYYFSPMENDLTLSFLDGVVTDDGEGTVTIQYMLNLGTIDLSLTSDYIGGEVNVEIKDLLKFLITLKDEVSSLSPASRKGYNSNSVQ